MADMNTQLLPQVVVVVDIPSARAAEDQDAEDNMEEKMILEYTTPKITLPFHDTNLGIQDIWLVNGVENTDTSFGPAVTYKNITGLVDCAIEAVCSFGTVLETDTIRSIRIHMEFTESEMSKLLGMRLKDFRLVGKFRPFTTVQDINFKALALSRIKPDIDMNDFIKMVSRSKERFYLSLSDDNKWSYHI